MYLLKFLAGNEAPNLTFSMNGTKEYEKSWSITCRANISIDALWWTVVRVPNGEAVNVTNNVANVTVKHIEHEGSREAMLTFKYLSLSDIGKYVCNAKPDKEHTQIKSYNLTFRGMSLI